MGPNPVTDVLIRRRRSGHRHRERPYDPHSSKGPQKFWDTLVLLANVQARVPAQTCNVFSSDFMNEKRQTFAPVLCICMWVQSQMF